ncbi:unnamed protein product [Medioppia subpectinata]|uniref:beta-mannosidase n=1 Tax=Medioppia subpectinata TaxID=1979941 RepID=A0A7R9PU95_9ACAR|nr:unnamed protein product [Medioppia subpectinata]CAG2100526.1 unnamed protein product [Medioppia subpectinata]
MFMFITAIQVKARVPGSIYSDLRREGVLKETLLSGNNDLKYRWVSYDNWTFERIFNVDEKLLSKQYVYLLANGIDTVSEVTVNDRLIGRTDNQFIRYKWDVKHVLKVGQNTVRVSIQSAPLYSMQKSKEYKEKYKYEVYPCAKTDNNECNYDFIRKMAASYSWDWGPAFPTQGIWKSLGVESYDRAVIRDIMVDTKPDPKTPDRWTFAVNAHIETGSQTPLDAIIDITLDGKPLVAKHSQRLTADPLGAVKADFVITIPEDIPITAWYPNGVADNTQQLYSLQVRLSFADSQEVSAQTKRIGFRTIRLVQSTTPGDGLTFYFEVNGQPVFAKGSNWIPANVLQEDLTEAYVRDLLVSARAANMNVLRVWGGGVYESDVFYGLADELGIMIWQDMMYACAPYPGNPEFILSADVEISQQIQRLQHHPSIALWAGNNEIEWLMTGQDEIHRVDYRELFVKHMQTLVTGADTSRPFVTSSPSNGLRDAIENYTVKNPIDFRYGDVHYYDYSTPQWDSSVYPRGKFISEFGQLSYPSLDTWLSALPDSDMTYPASAGVQHRNRLGYPPGVNGSKVIEQLIANYFKLPAPVGIERFADLIYLSQIHQAMAIRSQVELYRRNREVDPQTGFGGTMGALYCRDYLYQ